MSRLTLEVRKKGRRRRKSAGGQKDIKKEKRTERCGLNVVHRSGGNKIKLLWLCFGQVKKKKTLAEVTEREGESEKTMSRCQMGRFIFE